jgi:hypothetical protein
MERKKMAAALAAVNQYLAQESAAATAAGQAGRPSVWAAAGRQQIMQNRQVVTMRMWR